MTTRNSSTVVDTNQPNIQLSLSDRSITWLHSAGMAGLWMTLKQLEMRFPTVSQRPGQLNWNLSSHSIDLNWSGTDRDILDWLLRQAFQINQEGLILLTGLGSTLSIDAQIALHQGITGSFLQHINPINRAERND
jgi:CRISPR-associated protein Cas8a1/Csx13